MIRTLDHKKHLSIHARPVDVGLTMFEQCIASCYLRSRKHNLSIAFRRLLRGIGEDSELTVRNRRGCGYRTLRSLTSDSRLTAIAEIRGKMISVIVDPDRIAD